MSHFHPIGDVGRASDAQLQVDGKLNKITYRARGFDVGQHQSDIELSLKSIGWVLRHV